MRRTDSRPLAALALVVLVLVAGCSGAASGGGAQVSSDGAVAQTNAAVEAGDGGSGGSGDAESTGNGGVLQVEDRQRIRTGRVVLTVEDFAAAKRNLTAAVEQRGGFVSSSTQERHGGGDETYLTGSVTLRVPAEDFDAMMERVEAAGTVESSNTKTEDVTEQLVDIEARLENLRAERERLRGLYESANDTEAVLAVQERLSETQERIERLEAQQTSLQRQVAFATITVELREPRPERGPVEQWYDVPLVQAFMESVSGVGTTVRAIAVLVAYAAPYALAFAVPPVALGLGYLAYRRFEHEGLRSG